MVSKLVPFPSCQFPINTQLSCASKSSGRVTLKRFAYDNRLGNNDDVRGTMKRKFWACSQCTMGLSTSCQAILEARIRPS